jgi:cyclopropane-fatty-acyl-phospholipid synthase
MFNLEESRLAAARKLVAHIAEYLHADISVQLWNGEVLPLGPGARDDLRIVVASPVAVRRILLAPSLMTIWELYAQQQLDLVGGTPIEASRRWDHFRSLEIPKKLDRKLVLKAALPFLVGGFRKSYAVGAYDKLVDKRYANGRDDKSVIQFHYDVSNAFYALFLDPEMVYSCGYFRTPQTSLADAQIDKLDRICRKLQLRPGDRFLDVGCGWGGLLCHAASTYGAECHGVTLSKAQFDFVTEKIARLGLGDRIKLELRDYRSIEDAESYDKIAQIEMFEHVGLDNHDMHFAHIRKLLRPRGLYLHQASTRWATPDISKFREKTRYQKVVTRFIFPGGELDYVGLSTTNLERHGFEIHDIEGMREHFQLTLEHWVARLYENRDAAVAEIGLPKTRLWLLYLSLFARAFERCTVGVFQTLASKRQIGPSGLPLARADLFK